MNTNQIKKFATETRNRLIRGVSNQMKAYFNDRGTPHFEPIQVQGGCVYGETLRDERFYYAWQSLRKHIMLYGVKTTIEEVAYTWFNRLVAINILAKNNLAEPVLKFANPMVRVPLIVEQARSGQFPAMSVEARNTLNELLNDDSKTIEQFSFLIDCYCSANPIIKACFGSVDDYSYLLLPNNILAEGELVDMLNRSEYISDEDYQSPELIGWLYQFYISEKKDEVFAKKGKFESDEIPAATQIFTPNWIVKYMVQNSLGRIYLDNEPYSALADGMKYLVQSEPSAEKFTFTDVKELTCADLACGSGHILNECFDMLYDIYVEQGYSRKDAIENIFAHNLTGIDLDTRAKQMATFALLLKACRRDVSFADAHAMPRIFDMPDPYPRKDDLRDMLPHFFLCNTRKMIDETIEALELFDKAKDLGSIMKFNISPATREAISLRMSDYRSQGYKDFEGLFRYMDIILALTAKYASIVMNPPYMGSGNMNPVLSRYVKDNYEEGKADLFSTFMILAINRLAAKGKYGMINMHSWMFLSSFENLRKTMLRDQHIDNLLHLGPRTFDELGGEVVQNAAYVITKQKSSDYGIYYRLVDGKNCADKERMFLEAQGVEGVYYPNIPQSNFSKIPGSPIGYWVSENMIKVFSKPSIDKIATVITGMTIGDNNKYLRIWNELSNRKLAIGKTKMSDINIVATKWIPYSKGGTRRNWYGGYDYVVNWSKKDNFNRSKTTLQHLYLKEAVTWPFICSTQFSAKQLPAGFLWDVAGSPCFFENKEDELYTLGFMASKLCNLILKISNPTINVQAVDIARLPIIKSNTDYIIDLVKNSIDIAREDWNSSEVSWDFLGNELVRVGCKQGITSLSKIVAQYKAEWSEKFHQLHANEEELNRQFIEIYGLQDELTPEVPLDEITILQQGEISVENNNIVWHDDVIAKQLISYAIGCWFGRYRLDQPGLHIAHPAPTEDEIITYDYNGSQLQIDDDGISPILAADSSFDDNLCHRVRDFLRIVFGDEALIDNINWIEAALGKSLETYFIKDFWKDHKKMYQNRPIYWLFSSKKGAFQCLAYMHRMDAYTAERVRSKYLLPHMEWLANEIADMVANEAMLTTPQRRNLENLRKQLDECREYHDRLHVVADQQIGFDLDDGVVVNHAKFGDVLAKIK